MVNLNWADWTIFAVMAISCAFGLKRGLIKEVLSILNWILALTAAICFKDRLAFLLEDVVLTNSIREVIAFVILFFAALFVGFLVNFIIGFFIKASGMSTINRMFGFVFGLARGCIVVMALLLFVPRIISIEDDQWWSDSLFIPNFLEFEDWAIFATSEVKSWSVQSIDYSDI